jgi:iron complex transport system substrate-binding protein
VKIVCAGLLAALLAAPAPPAAAQTQAGSSATIASPAVNWPMEVTDGAGARVTIRRPPRRIASLTLMTDEILLDLAGPERLVAATPMSDDPGISNVAGRVPAGIKRLALDVEQLVALAPDLVFVASWSNADTVRQLRDAGLTIYRVGSPRSVDEVKWAIGEIGRVVDARDRALALVADMDRTLAAVRARVESLQPAERLRVLDYDSSGSSFGRGSSWDDIVRRAGCVNAAGELAADQWGRVAVSQERLIAIDPDLIVLPGWKWEDPDGARRARDRFVRDPAWRGLKAIASGRVLLADERHRLATSQYIVKAIEDLAAVAYPRLFPR